MNKENDAAMKSNPLGIKWQKVKDLVKSCVLPYGKTFHAFLCFSNEDRDFASKLFETLGSLGLKICFHDRDFIPGRSIFDNITTAIKDSFKTVLVLSPQFNTSDWCIYEAELTVSLGIEMNQSKMLIPLLCEEMVEIPDFLKIFSLIDARGDVDVWFTELLMALSTSPKKLNKLDVPVLPETYENHFLLLYHQDDEEFAVKECRFLSVGEEAFICRHFPVYLEAVTSLSHIDMLVNLLKVTLKVVIVISKSFESENSCLYLCNLIRMAHNDIGKPSCNIIPLLLDDTRATVPGSLSDITYLPVDSCDERWRRRLHTACCLTQTLTQKAGITASGEKNVIRISEFKPESKSDQKQCRILDILFIQDSITIADYNNKKLKLYTITGQLVDEMLFETHPYPLTRVDGVKVGVVLRSLQQIAVVDVSNKLSLLHTVHCGKSVSAASLTKNNSFIISTMDEPCVIYEVGYNGKVVRNVVPSRITAASSKQVLYIKCDENHIVTVDEKRRQIAVYSQDGTLLMYNPAYSSDAYVIRGISLQKDKIFVAADNTVKYFKIRKEGRVVKKLELQDFIKDFQDTKFTRCIDIDRSSNFMALSHANDKCEFIRILKIK